MQIFGHWLINDKRWQKSFQLSSLSYSTLNVTRMRDGPHSLYHSYAVLDGFQMANSTNYCESEHAPWSDIAFSCQPSHSRSTLFFPPPLHFASSASKTLQADTQSLSSLCSVCPSYFIHPWLTTSQEVPNNPLTLRTISFIWAAELRSINSADQCHNDCNFNVTSHVHLNIVFSALANLLMSVINRPWLTMARQTLWTQACRVSRWTLGRPLLMAKIGTRLLIY